MALGSSNERVAAEFQMKYISEISCGFMQLGDWDFPEAAIDLPTVTPEQTYGMDESLCLNPNVAYLHR